MHPATVPDSTAPLRLGLQQGWRALTLAAQRAVQALVSARREAALHRRAWRRRRAIAHLSAHLLNDIGADSELLAYAEAQRRVEELRTSALWLNAGS
jgi:uncharacterized protein YjiS (DUF1127 family)